MYAQINAAHAQRVHFAIQFGEHLARLALIAIRTDALDTHRLPQQVNDDGFVPCGRTEADADGTFHGGRK
jgi:hypothetical protein